MIVEGERLASGVEVSGVLYYHKKLMLFQVK
jgi:hypothetical protein